jgi:hypothetical protein
MKASGQTLRLIALASMLLAGPAPAASAAAVSLRGPEPAEPTRQDKTAAAPLRPVTAAPRLADTLEPDQPSSPRIGGIEAGPGGAQCRLACAKDLYICRSDRDEDECSPIWSRCVAACPEGSSSPL